MDQLTEEAELPDLVHAVRDAGLLAHGARSLVMLSGGGDSVALLGVAIAVCGRDSVVALHVNYGLRGEQSDGDQAHCEQLCRDFDVMLQVEQVNLPENGNLQELARDERYRLARQAAKRHRCDKIAVAHNADDRAETILYRLAASPGRRSLLGMPRSRGEIVRPLLDFTRAQLRAWCESQELSWREDSSNADPRFARTHARAALAELRELHPAAIANMLRTAEEIAVENEAIGEIVDGLLKAALNPSTRRLSATALGGMAPSLAALVLREFVEQQTGAPAPAARSALGRVLDASVAGGSKTIEIEGSKLSIEYGEIGVVLPDGELPAGPPPSPAPLSLPGEIVFGDWRIAAAAVDATTESGAHHLLLTGDLAKAPLLIRPRLPGDRMRPRGLGGSKSLQDLMVDRKVPRSQRDRLPVVCAGDEIVWVPGLAKGELAPLPRHAASTPQGAVLLTAKPL